MATRDDIRDSAKMFDWRVSDQRDYDTYVKANHVIQVRYRKDGSVEKGELYEFFKVDDLNLVEIAAGKHRKGKILHWLVA